MEFDVIETKDLQALVNSVEAYVKSGWVLKGKVFEQNGYYTQQVERHVAQNTTKKRVNNQKSWIAWPQLKQ